MVEFRHCIIFMKLIGKVIHYYGKVGVAIIRLEDTLRRGDGIRIAKGEQSFDQEVTSIQKEYQDVEEAVPGDEVGVKVDEKVHEGAIVIRLEEGD